MQIDQIYYVDYMHIFDKSDLKQKKFYLNLQVHRKTVEMLKKIINIQIKFF